ncbi:hypothetical protein DPMN_092771 [Dreissena polymorpha]|uniref:Uncharacterized protein n=1 Tax=Dreissena polymorpha TaxID=45954 RepID=A0A9D4L2R9_DREPO|nr:hypothetical protein DPMN_092771 [Dreissena polymorpha]
MPETELNPMHSSLYSSHSRVSERLKPNMNIRYAQTKMPLQPSITGKSWIKLFPDKAVCAIVIYGQTRQPILEAFADAKAFMDLKQYQLQQSLQIMTSFQGTSAYTRVFPNTTTCTVLTLW